MMKSSENQPPNPETDEKKGELDPVFDRINDCIVLLNKKGVIQDVNSKTLDLSGWERHELVGQHFSEIDLVDPADENRIRKTFDKIIDGSKTRLDFSFKNREGKQIELELSGSMIGKEENRILVIARDITRRKRIVEELRRSKEKYRALSDHSADIIYRMDIEDEEYRYISPSAKRIFGYSVKEALSLNPRDVLTPDSYRKQSQALQKVLEKGDSAPEIMELQAIHKDGHIFDIEVNADFITDEEGNPVEILGVARDITEKKRAERELRDREKRLDLAVFGGDLGTWDWDIRTNEVRFNERWAEMKGYSMDEIEQRLSTWENLVHPEDLPKAYTALNSHLEGETEFYEAEFRMRHKSGNWIWVLDRGKVIERDSNGNPIRACGTHLDITDRKQAERNLKKYSRHLEDQVEERTKELREAERLAAIGETATMVGHDLRNPLQAIFNNIYLAKRKINSWVIEEPRGINGKQLIENLETIEKCSRYMNKIVADLEDFSKDVEANPRQVDVKEIFEDVVSNTPIPDNVNLSFNIPNEFRNATVDPHIVSRCLANLVTNGVQAMPDGGNLIIRASQQNGEFLIQIRDNGMGIPEENLERIFDPLFSTKSQGQGLGMAVCRRLMDAHNGEIEVESELGKGTTFTVKIPQDNNI